MDFTEVFQIIIHKNKIKESNKIWRMLDSIIVIVSDNAHVRRKV